MAQTYPTSDKRLVFHPVGKFNGSQQMKCVKAPFDLVRINGTLYLEPVSRAFSTEAIAQLSDADAEVAGQSSSGYYIDPEPVIVEKHMLGASYNTRENWLTMHRFSDI